MMAFSQDLQSSAGLAAPCSCPLDTPISGRSLLDIEDHMARIRTIKPEFPQSESVGRLSREARLLFIQLWTIADDAGRFRAASRMLASLLYPFDDDVPNLIEGWLAELEAEKCVRRYQVNGTTYGEIIKWLEHQKIDRPSQSKLPSFDEYSRTLANTREASTTDLGPRTMDQGPRTLATPPNGGADEPPDLKAILFGPALRYLAKGSGRQEGSTRSQVGRWIKEFGEAQTLMAISAAQRQGAVEPIAYTNGALRNGAAIQKSGDWLKDWYTGAWDVTGRSENAGGTPDRMLPEPDG